MNTNKGTIYTSEDILKNIARKIETLEIKPGSKISENEIAQTYQVSRTVVRSAFAILREWGLIEVYPQRGTYITKINVAYIRDMQFVRNAVETAVMKEVMKKKDKSQLLTVLQKNLKEQEKFKHLKKYEDEFFRLDESFHRAFMDFIHRENIPEIINLNIQNIQFRRWRYLEVETLVLMEKIIEQHTCIYEAVKKGNERQAVEVLQEHLLTASQTSFNIWEKYPDFFVHTA